MPSGLRGLSASIPRIFTAAARHELALVCVLALAWGGVLAVGIRQPGYTDAYYYFNAGQRLAQGEGLTDAYLWTYFNAPERLPAPSHTYWMPLASLVAAVSMGALGPHFGAAQVGSVLCLAGLVALAYAIGQHIGVHRRHARRAAVLVAFSGFFTPFWTTTDTFALYGLIGAGALAVAGHARATGTRRWYAFAGALCGLAHLTRADGLVLLGIVILVACWPGAKSSRAAAAGIALLAYLVIMGPWLARNTAAIGAPLPTGASATIWMRSYDEIVNYPPGASLSAFADWGLANIVRSRLEAFANNLGTFVVVETWVILGPLVLAGLWPRRRDPIVAGALCYAVVLHGLMTLVFAFPGYRGGLFHSSSALLPFWAAGGSLGLDAAVDWAARRRRWKRAQAQRVFGWALIVFAVVLSIGVFAARLNRWNQNGEFYSDVTEELPANAVLMVNDPAALYYHTGRSGVVVPNAAPAVVPEIAQRYEVGYLLLDANRTRPFAGLFAGTEDYPFLRLLKVWGDATPSASDDRRLYEIVLGP